MNNGSKGLDNWNKIDRVMTIFIRVVGGRFSNPRIMSVFKVPIFTIITP